MSASQQKIILMDDEPLIQKVTGQMLQSLGYEVLIATKGEEAVAIYREHLEKGNPVDALLMDLSIVGGMGAEETMQILQQMDENVKAIVSTGFAHDKQVVSYSEYGFAASLIKPYKLVELKETLEKVLNG